MSDDELVEKVATRLRKIQHHAGLIADVDLPNHFAEAALAEVREHEAAIAAAVERLLLVDAPDPWFHRDNLRAALTDTGAAEALRKRDAEVLTRAADRIEPDVPASTEVRDWLYDYAAHIDAETDTHEGEQA